MCDYYAVLYEDYFLFRKYGMIKRKCVVFMIESFIELLYLGILFIQFFFKFNDIFLLL